MRSHSHFEGLSFPPAKTRARSSRAKHTPGPRPESPSSVPETKIEAFAPANRGRSGLTTVEKAGAAAQGVAKGLAGGLGAELAIGFAVGATGVAASTIIWMLLPVPIYAIATHWDKIAARASRLCAGKGTPHDYKAAGELAGGLFLISAAGSGTDVIKESGPAVEALCRDESQE